MLISPSLFLFLWGSSFFRCGVFFFEWKKIHISQELFSFLNFVFAIIIVVIYDSSSFGSFFFYNCNFHSFGSFRFNFFLLSYLVFALYCFTLHLFSTFTLSLSLSVFNTHFYESETEVKEWFSNRHNSNNDSVPTVRKSGKMITTKRKRYVSTVQVNELKIQNLRNENLLVSEFSCARDFILL